MVRWCLRAIVVVALAVLPAGCGGDDNATDAGATTPTVTAPTTSPTVPATTGTTGTTRTSAPQTERERIAACLEAEGYRLQGGKAPSGGDTELPEYQIIFGRPRGGGGYIGFYRNRSRAMRVAKQVRQTVQRMSGAAVERHGSINIVWIDLPDPAARERVRGCLVT